MENGKRSGAHPFYVAFEGVLENCEFCATIRDTDDRIGAASSVKPPQPRPFSGSRASKTAQRVLEKLLELDRRQQIDPATILQAYVGMGNNDQALAYLEKAYAQHSNTLTTLKVDPRFDPLRGDARFQEMQRRVGL